VVDDLGGQDWQIRRSVLAFLHKREAKRVAVKQITEAANRILRAQGEIVEYSPQEVGHRLKAIGLFTKRGGSGKGLPVCRETSRAAHRLARMYEVPSVVNSVQECPDCPAAQAIAVSPVL
jgi:hypothetical protein